MSTPALSIQGVRRTFGATVAVDDVDLTVEAGTFTGLLGPNGAGKSTRIACTVGLDRPDAGTSAVFGQDVWDDPVQARRLMGVLPDNLALPEYLSGRELLGHWGRLHGLPADEVDARADSLLRVLELNGSAERTLVLDYSTGMRKKIGIAVALTLWQVTGAGAWVWVAAGVALVTAVVAGWGLGRLAVSRLQREGPELLHRMRSGPSHQAVGADAAGRSDQQVEVAQGSSPATPSSPAKPSGYDGLTLGEQRVFWLLCTLVPLALFPQGLVAMGHLLADSGVRGWFVALRMPEPWQWPTAVGFVVLAIALAGIAVGLYRRGVARVAPPSESEACGGAGSSP